MLLLVAVATDCCVVVGAIVRADWLGSPGGVETVECAVSETGVVLLAQ